MSLPTPTSTNSPFNPDNNTAMDLSSGSGKNTDEKNSAEQKSPEMKQDRSADTSNNGAEDIWQQLETLKAQAQQRKKAAEAAIASGPNAIRSSEPVYRTPTPQQAPANHSTQNNFTNANGSSKSIDPILFKNLGRLNRREISHGDYHQIAPKPRPAPLPAVWGEWTRLHLEVAKDLKKISVLIDSGESVNAISGNGLTLLHAAVIDADAAAVKQLLAAGANPLACKIESFSIISLGLARGPEIALMLAEALPMGAKSTVESDGNTEIHRAVNYPEVLHVLLSKGMRDSTNKRGETALINAVMQGQLLSVKYLLGQRPAGETEAEYAAYLNHTTDEDGISALAVACYNNHDTIAELLMRHGALPRPCTDFSLLGHALAAQNLRLFNLLLAHGAADYEADLTSLLFKAAKYGQTDAVSALGPYTELNHEEQHKLLTKWLQNRSPETLAAISSLLPQSSPSIRTLTKSQGFLNVAFKEKSPELLVAMLEFFEGRDSLHFVIQSYCSQLIDDDGDILNADMGKALLNFALPRFSRLSHDRETVMRLVQLSEKLGDYTIITEIKSRNFSGKNRGIEKVPFEPSWVSDPVSLELLGVKHEEDDGIVSKFIHTLSSLMNPYPHADILDEAQLSNDLIFALKSVTVGDALDEVFDTHRISAINRQVLKPLLQGLISQLYPVRETRTDAVCRFLIAYALSTLKDNPKFSEHPALKMIESKPAWERMNQKLASEVEAFDVVATTILETVVSAQLWETLPDDAVRLSLASISQQNPESFLTQSFRLLGALDVPARRLAQACASAVNAWQTQGGMVPSSGKLSQSDQLLLKTLISNELSAKKQRASLPEQLASTVQQVESELNPAFHEMLWWQWDLMHRAFGIDTTGNSINPSDSEGLSGNSSNETGSEKS